ncbi:hypothetical protein [Pantoea sp. At-9b]|uniref:hypothetical protein n=1 Tax=Pantoea sp. (strain At-9b) TaxID=592316 RepID=UPI0001F25F83|nr:hypothetical protein [Pantoea sp. At-9b]ADU72601.1 conserved hypothetical protein [Pantoea sp. At-9b]
MENKFRKWLVTAVMYILLGCWFWYMLWASSISKNTILQKSVHEWIVYISFGVFVGCVSLVYAFYQRTFNKTLKYLLNAFLGGLFFGFMLILNCYDVYVYLFPDKIIGYKSEYEVVFPGPSRGKHGHCEAGIWLKDQNTSRWIQLCTNKDYLYSHRKQGMTGVWVTVRVNKIGTYIVKYEFIYM